MGRGLEEQWQGLGWHLQCSCCAAWGAVGVLPARRAVLSLLWAPDLAPRAALGCELHQRPSLLRGQMSPALSDG